MSFDDSWAVFFFFSFDHPYDHTLLIFKLEMDEYLNGN
jgi:hypothetical protein